MAYSGELDRARELQARGRAGAVSPIDARVEPTTWPGRSRASPATPRAAERHYLRAIDLARAAGATFLDGVASVGLVALRGRAGRIADALRGYRDVVDYFARTGNWTHLWPALRNLADLLRRIGDPDPAAVLDAAADHAPDAPAIDRSGRPLEPQAVSIEPRRGARGRPGRDRAEPQSVSAPTSDPFAGRRTASTNASSPTHAV